jgi:3-deoxy-manno-octulosonate cytidylyltransferase (CMP-KDO synthetase)
MKVLGVIPARFKSTRLEGKVLADIGGKPMVRHVYERALRSGCLDEVLVAADDERILAAVKEFGGKAVMTAESHTSGTDRVAEVAQRTDADVVVNVQGDEPMLDPAMIEELVAPFRSSPGLDMVTIKKRVLEESEFADPSVVKVVTDRVGFALYFSRSLIPYPRRRTGDFKVFEHVGLYAYTRECLLKLASLPPTPLEEAESLEQLRALENGVRILVVETACEGELLSVDTQADLERVRRILAEEAGA